MTKSSQQGFSVIELIISIGILALIVAIVLQYINNTHQQQLILRSQNEMKLMNQEGLTRLSSSLAQTKRLFDRSGAGPQLFAYNGTPANSKWEVEKAPPPILGSRLPYVQLIGSLSPENNCVDFPTNYFWAPAVGNSLAYAQLVGSFSDFPASVSEKRKIDVYRFQYIYITDFASEAGEKNYIYAQGSAKLPAQALIEWRSVNYADYRQLQNYIDALPVDQRSTAISALRNSPQGAEFAWDTSVNNLVATNSPYPFYQINSANLTGISAHRLKYKQHLNVMRMKSDGEIIYSVAYNTRTTKDTGNFPIKAPVPQFFQAEPSPPCPSALPTPAATPASDFSFPRGFEVMIVGPASGRKIMLYSTLTARTRFGYLSAYPEIQITAVKDL